MISSGLSAEVITFDFLAQVVHPGSSTLFTCNDTATFTCRTNLGLWKDDYFTGSISYDTDSVPLATWYWGGARFDDLPNSNVTLNIDGGVTFDSLDTVVYDDAPYLTTDMVEIRDSEADKSIYFEFGSDLEGTLDSLMMPVELPRFIGELVSRGSYQKIHPTNSQQAVTLQFQFVDLSIARTVNDPAYTILFLVAAMGLCIRGVCLE